MGIFAIDILLLWVLRDCGWCNNDGRPQGLAISASKLQWEQLSPAMRLIIEKKTAQGLLGW